MNINTADKLMESHKTVSYAQPVWIASDTICMDFFKDDLGAEDDNGYGGLLTMLCASAGARREQDPDNRLSKPKHKRIALHGQGQRIHYAARPDSGRLPSTTTMDPTLAGRRAWLIPTR